VTSPARAAAHAAIRAYQLTLSGLIGRQCRHAPSCSEYTDEAIQRHGLWAGGFVGLARVCRCHPWGTDGFDPAPQTLPPGAHWTRPWAYGVWRGPLPGARIMRETGPKPVSIGGAKGAGD
jgi:uncharacterized protein